MRSEGNLGNREKRFKERNEEYERKNLGKKTGIARKVVEQKK